jgi:membrane peptidoglycan carboxypeptidase
VHGIRVTGGSFPAQIWRLFMDSAIGQLEDVDFPEPKDWPEWTDFERGQYARSFGYYPRSDDGGDDDEPATTEEAETTTADTTPLAPPAGKPAPPPKPPATTAPPPPPPTTEPAPPSQGGPTPTEPEITTP